MIKDTGWSCEDYNTEFEWELSEEEDECDSEVVDYGISPIMTEYLFQHPEVYEEIKDLL